MHSQSLAAPLFFAVASILFLSKYTKVRKKKKQLSNQSMFGHEDLINNTK
jgi:hypothetical protein